MNALLFLVPIAILLGGVFAALFAFAACNGQFDDLEDPPLRMLEEGPNRTPGVCDGAPGRPIND